MSISFKDIFANLTTFVQRATTFDEAKINAFFQGLNNEINYVTSFVVHQLPVLISDAKGVAAAGLVAGKAIPGAVGAEITAAAVALQGAITVLENIVSSISQSGQQPSSAQSLTMHPDPKAALAQARIAQSDVDAKKAAVAKLIAQNSK